jgi:hypothetical protein
MVKQLPTLLKTVEIFGIYGNDLDLHWRSIGQRGIEPSANSTCARGLAKF